MLRGNQWQACMAAVAIMVALMAGGVYGAVLLINKLYMMPSEIEPIVYPKDSIDLIVPFSAGGGLDLQARVLAAAAPRYLGEKLTVVNQPGEAGEIGWDEMLSVKPDGYTIGMTSLDTLLPPLYGVTKYHYTSALAPIAQISTSYFILAVRADAPYRSVAELVQYAKEHPNALRLGHPGIGSMPHVLGELLAHVTGTALGQTPFKGSSEALAALLENRVQLVFASPSALQKQIKTGRLRALAVTSPQRPDDPVLAAAPTFQELGLTELVFTNWRCVAVAKNTPIEVQKILQEAFAQVAQDPAVREDVAKLGLQLDYLGPKETQQKWIGDSDRLYRILAETGILERIRAQKR